MPKNHLLSGFKFRSRSLLVIVVIAGSAISAMAGAKDQTFTRQDMLKAMAQNCIVPGLREIAKNADEFYVATQNLTNQPSEESLVQVLQAWRKFQLAYRGNEMLKYGPIENQVFWQANFFRYTSPTVVENIIRSNRQLDENLIERFGATAKGFPTIGYLLFGNSTIAKNESGTNSWLLHGNSAFRRRQYLCLITGNLDENLQAAEAEAGNANFPNTFAKGGQNSLNLLVNQLAATLEGNVFMPMNSFWNDLFMKGTVRGYAERNTEGLSDMKAVLHGLNRFYLGNDGAGLDAYVRVVNPTLSDHLKEQFQSASATLDVLEKTSQGNMPTQRAAVENALQQVHKLEILMKVDLTSAMGVTIMFSGYDGD